MEWDKFTPIDFDKFVPTELRIPGIRQYLHDVLGNYFEQKGFKFKKSNFSFKRKNRKAFEEILFLFYNYHPVNYRFEFYVKVFNEKIESVKLSLPPQSHREKFNRYSLLIRTSDFSHHLKTKSSAELGYDYNIVTLDDLIEVGKALTKTFQEEVLPLLDQLTTIEGIDNFFVEKKTQWVVKSGLMNNMSTELIAARLNGKRDYHNVYKGLHERTTAAENPDWQTAVILENLYNHLESCFRCE